jgi:heme-degrading monooxygenase HmoA
MITVIFEVWPKAGKAAEYFDIAASLRPELAKIDGFISIERFESVTTPGKFVSIVKLRGAPLLARPSRTPC